MLVSCQEIVWVTSTRVCAYKKTAANNILCCNESENIRGMGGVGVLTFIPHIHSLGTETERVSLSYELVDETTMKCSVIVSPF